MKKTGLVLTLAVAFIAIAACPASDADASEASNGDFPSISEIFSTIDWPDYGFDTFMDDAKIVLSMEMWNHISTYLGELVNFIVEDTFIGKPFDISEEQFTGDTWYVNVFMLLCIIIAIVCILGALYSYFVNRDTFHNSRKKHD